jgi:hypothetical protein
MSKLIYLGKWIGEPLSQDGTPIVYNILGKSVIRHDTAGGNEYIESLSDEIEFNSFPDYEDPYILDSISFDDSIELKYGELKNTQTIVQVEYQRESGLRNTQTIVQVEYSDDTFHLIESVSFDDSIEQFTDIENLEEEISFDSSIQYADTAFITQHVIEIVRKPSKGIFRATQLAIEVVRRTNLDANEETLLDSITFDDLLEFAPDIEETLLDGVSFDDTLIKSVSETEEVEDYIFFDDFIYDLTVEVDETISFDDIPVPDIELTPYVDDYIYFDDEIEVEQYELIEVDDSIVFDEETESSEPAIHLEDEFIFYEDHTLIGSEYVSTLEDIIYFNDIPEYWDLPYMEDEVSFDDQANQWFEFFVSDEIQFDDFLNETYIFWSYGSKKFIYSEQFRNYPENYFRGDYVDLSFYISNIDPYWVTLFYQYMVLRDSRAIIPDSFEFFKSVIIRSKDNWIELGEPLPYYIFPTTYVRIVKDNVKKHSFHYVKKSEKEKSNIVKVEYVSRRQRYKVDIIEEVNHYSIEEEKEIREQTFKLHSIKRVSQATRMNSYYYDYEQFVNYKITLETDTLAYFLRVGNIIGIVEDIMGWNGKEFRITKIEETEFGTNRIEAEEYVRTIYHDYSSPYPLPPDFEYDQGSIPRYLIINHVERFRVYEDKQLCRIYFMMMPSSTDSGEAYFSGVFITTATSDSEDDPPSLTEYTSVNGIIKSIPPSVAITSIEDNYVNYDQSTMYSSFPNSGTLIIDDEEIYYTELDEERYRFTGITRGFNGTEVQDHEEGTFAYLKSSDLYYINYDETYINKYHWFRALAVNFRGLVPTTGIIPWDVEFIDSYCENIPFSVSSLKVTYIGDIEESSGVNNYPRALEDGILFNDILNSDLISSIETIIDGIRFDDITSLKSDSPELISDSISFNDSLEFFEFPYLEDNITFNDGLFHTDGNPIDENLADGVGFNDIIKSTLPTEYFGDFVEFNDDVFIELILDSLNYYVSINGDDSNTGTSIESPWRTLSYASSLDLDPGSTINMKKGDIWQMSDALSIVHGGASGDYITWNGSPNWGSGDNATIKNTSNREWGDLAVVNIVACKYLKFKDIIVDGDNYNADGGIIIGGNRGASRIYQDDEDFIIIDGVLVENMGSDAYSNGIIIQTWYTPMSNIQILNSIVDGVADHGITSYPGRTELGASGSEINNLLINNCIVTNFNIRDKATGYGVHLNNKTYNAIVEYCTIMRGINGRGVGGVFIESNDSQSGFYPQGLTIRNNIIRDIKDWGIWIQKGQAVTADFYNNLIFNNGGPETSWGGGVRIDSYDYSGGFINFYNNTFYNNGYYAPSGKGLNFYISNGVTGNSVFNFKNNLIYVINLLGIDCQVAGKLTHSNNLIFRNGGGNIVRDGTSNYNSSNIINWEPSVQTEDPLFVNTSQLPDIIDSEIGPNQDGLNVQSGSSAIDNGTTISLFDTSINNVERQTARWDIGAYEN